MIAAPHRVTHLVAHRGNAADYPENTLPALRSACSLGVRFALLDVQLAGDETPVVCRDVVLARTAGLGVSVFELATGELASVDVSEPERFGERHRGASLPPLGEVAALCLEHPEITLLLELRRESLAQYGAELVVGRVREVLRGVRTQCVVVSRDLGAVQLARTRAGFRVGWVLTDYDGHSRLKYEALRPEFLLIDAAALPRSGRLWRGPWRWVVLGVDDADAAQAFAERGADFVATAAVGALSAALRARARTY